MAQLKIYTLCPNRVITLWVQLMALPPNGRNGRSDNDLKIVVCDGQVKES